MTNAILIKLDEPVTAFSRAYDSVTLNAPKAGLYLRLGEPRQAVYNGNSGSGYLIEQRDVIRQYLDHLVDVGDAAAQVVVLKEMSHADAVRLKEALFSFFDQAATRAAELKWTTSSSE